MKFIKYNSIDNVTNKELMRFKESNLYDPSATWYVTEKVHGCLDENTTIQTSVGDITIKKICEDYPNINYKIKSYNIDTKSIEWVDCTNVSVQDNINNWLLVTLEDGTNLLVTSNHKIYLPEHNCYRQANQLQVGDRLLVTEKLMKTLKIVSIKPIEHSSNRYDIETRDNHNFFANGILVHNSNFAIMSDGKGPLIPAKRSSTLDMENSSFFNFQKIFDKYDFNALTRKILFMATGYNPDYNYGVSIHGELCGGSYPNTPVIPGAKQVQKEIKYSNDTEFIVFDIRIYNKDGGYVFLSHEAVVRACEELKIPVVPILFKGTLDQCLAWSAEHNADPSEVWKIFGMEQEVPNNIREGHVIKPAASLFNSDSRIIFKDKNDKFKEGNEREPKQKVEKIPFSTQMNDLYNKITSMICIPRFNNVTSKFGEYTIRNFADLMRLMTDDIFEDLKNDANMSSLTAVEKKTLKDDTIRRVSAFMGANKRDLF